MRDGDPYLMEMVLHNLCTVSIFSFNMPLNPEYKQKTIWYQDKLGKSNVRIYENCTFDRIFLKLHDKITRYLKKCTEPFEVIASVDRQILLKEIDSNQHKVWVFIPQDIKLKITDIVDKIKDV